jgi:hypothetical protein
MSTSRRCVEVIAAIQSMEAHMRAIIAFAGAFCVAAAAFVITMITQPPVSEAGTISSIDTYALTMVSPIVSGQEYDCN